MPNTAPRASMYAKTSRIAMSSWGEGGQHRGLGARQDLPLFQPHHKLQPYNAKLLLPFSVRKSPHRLRIVEAPQRSPHHRLRSGPGSLEPTGLRAYGLRSGSFELPKAIDCATSKKCSRTSRVSPFPRTSRLSSQAMVGWGKALVKCWTT